MKEQTTSKHGLKYPRKITQKQALELLEATAEHIIAYPGKDGVLKDWHGNPIGTWDTQTTTQEKGKGKPDNAPQRDRDGRLIEQPGKHYAGAGAFRYEVSEPRCYRIIRFRFNGRPRTIRKNVTLSEAQAHCKRPDTSSHSTGNGSWFDGYDYTKGCKPLKSKLPKA